MNKSAVIAATAAGAYVVYDSLNAMGRVGLDSVTSIDRMMGLTRDFFHVRPSGLTGAFVEHRPTNLPVIAGSAIVPGLRSTQSWNAIQRMAVETVQGGQGTGATLAALASVEVQHGDLSVQCDNCNLFSIHAEANEPFYIRGNAYFESFIANNSEIEGYRQCMIRLRELFNRQGYSGAIAACVEDNPDRLQAILSANGWSPSYNSPIPYIRNRLRRLQSLGLIHA